MHSYLADYVPIFHLGEMVAELIHVSKQISLALTVWKGDWTILCDAPAMGQGDWCPTFIIF